jgi:integrase
MPLEITHEDFLNPDQVKRLKDHCRQQAERAATGDRRRNPVRDWAILHVALDSGLRVSEICALQIRDVILDAAHSSLIVRDGKGHKKRGVRIGSSLVRHLTEFIAWKSEQGESVAGRAPLFVSARGGPLTRTAVYRIFRRAADEVDIPTRFSIHSCRHTYASLLYKASDFNLRLVQKQLGHRSIQTTQIYADVLSEDAVVAVERLPQ